jgi:hypothetical protein
MQPPHACVRPCKPHARLRASSGAYLCCFAARRRSSLPPCAPDFAGALCPGTSLPSRCFCRALGPAARPALCACASDKAFDGAGVRDMSAMPWSSCKLPPRGEGTAAQPQKGRRCGEGHAGVLPSRGPYRPPNRPHEHPTASTNALDAAEQRPEWHPSDRCARLVLLAVTRRAPHADSYFLSSRRVPFLLRSHEGEPWGAWGLRRWFDSRASPHPAPARRREA